MVGRGTGWFAEVYRKTRTMTPLAKNPWFQVCLLLAGLSSVAILYNAVSYLRRERNSAKRLPLTQQIASTASPPVRTTFSPPILQVTSTMPIVRLTAAPSVVQIPSQPSLVISNLALGPNVAARSGSVILWVPDQYDTIQKAIDVSRSNDTVRVKAGVYDEALTFKNGIRLIGESMDRVTVRYNADQNVVGAIDCNAGLINGFTFEHIGSATGDRRNAVVGLQNSSIEVFQCKIQRGVGSGIIIANGGHPFIRECTIQSNPFDGIQVGGKESTPILKENKCRNNKREGIVFVNGAGGEAEFNECESNERSGIEVTGKNTMPSLRHNSCRGNQNSGIRFNAGARGTAEGNTCENNKVAGIFVENAETNPTLKGNFCLTNEYGIYFGPESGGDGLDNTCENNKNTGIVVQEGSLHALTGNRCNNNALFGIYSFNELTEKVKTSNTATGNGSEQIHAKSFTAEIIVSPPYLLSTNYWFNNGSTPSRPSPRFSSSFGDKCFDCGGSGSVGDLFQNPCATCGGSGKLRKCELCNGTGKTKEKEGFSRCFFCSGKGWTPAGKW